jgi:pyruvate dehydrogenase E2 component (dihydrolipoamide acetyltransferase)
VTSLTLPQLSISMEDAKVAHWLVEDGATVTAGQAIVEVETDKATMEVEAPADGILRIVAAPGTIVPVDGVLAEIVGAVAPPVAGPTAPVPQAHAPAAGNGAAAAKRGGPIASPAARRIAAERGVDLTGLEGSGPAGRIVARDVAAVAPTASGARLRDAVVANIVASWQRIPHIQVGGELVADGLVAARAALPPSPVKVTLTDLLALALARALAEVPELNATLRRDGTVERSSRVNLSLAVATADGVVAPVLRDAGGLSLADLARERARLVAAAREGRLAGRDLAGGTCTLSNLGAYPVDFFTPVISGPQVATVATGRVAEKAVAENGWIAVRTRMWANVAIDHRAADGEAGGRLLAALERRIASLAAAVA